MGAGARVLPYVLAIARNAAYDELRSAEHRRVRLTPHGEVPEPEEFQEAEAPPEDDRTDALRQALSRLPFNYREALRLTKELEMTAKEAGVVVGATETAMKLRVHRAYKRLRQELAKPERE